MSATQKQLEDVKQKLRQKDEQIKQLGTQITEVKGITCHPSDISVFLGVY
jgi:hypothetical protein